MSCAIFNTLLDPLTDPEQKKVSHRRLIYMVYRNEITSEVVLNFFITKVFDRNEETGRNALIILDRVVANLLQHDDFLKNVMTVGFCENLFQHLTTNIISDSMKKDLLQMIGKWNDLIGTNNIKELVEQLTFVGFQFTQTSTVRRDVDRTVEADICNNRQFESKILSLIECPVCLEVMNPPIYQCDLGHSVCNRCKSGLETCPTCRGFFGRARNFILEKLISELDFACHFNHLGCADRISIVEAEKHAESCIFKPRACRYKNFGCQVIRTEVETEEHEKVCIFEPLPCEFQYSGCTEMVQLSDTVKHESICEFRPVQCSYRNTGCMELSPQIRVQEHECHCRFKPRPCIFSVTGCPKMVTVADSEKHEFHCDFAVINFKPLQTVSDSLKPI